VNDAASGATVIVRDMLVEWLTPSLSAVIVTFVVPRVAVTVEEKDTETKHPGVPCTSPRNGHGLRVKEAVTPLGRPDAVKVTNPDEGAFTSHAAIQEDGLVPP